MNSRRGFFKTLFGAAAAVVAAPLIPVAQPSVVTGMPYLGGYIFCPYIPLTIVREIMPTFIASELIAVQPMDAPTGTVFHMSIEPIK